MKTKPTKANKENKVPNLLTAPLTYKYFVAYSFNAGRKGSGNGMVEFTRSAAIRTYDDVAQTAAEIERINSWKPKSVVLINWILL